MLNVLLGLILSIYSLSGSLIQTPVSATDGLRLEREFIEHFRSVEIENTRGRIEAIAWSKPSVRLVATRQNGDGSLDSAVAFEQPARDTLKVTVMPAAQAAAVDLVVFIPVDINLSIKGGKGAVAVKGLPLALSAETEAGDIAFYVPSDSNADLSLRAVEGSIESKLEIVTFGQQTAKLLDGRIGRGGSPVILRTARGRISLFQDDSTRMSAANRRSVETGSIESGRGGGNAYAPTRVEPAAFSGKTIAGNAAGPDAGSSDADTIKLEARLVNLNVKVVDAMGRPVANLKKDDFEILEDNSRQPAR